MAETKTISGTVTKVTQKEGQFSGLKIEGREAYFNPSKAEYRKEPFEIPQEGDRIEMQVTPWKDAFFIQSMKIMGVAQPPAVYENGQVPAGGRDLSIVRQVCVKAAAEIVSSRAATYADTVGLGIDVLALAQEFEQWILREENPYAE